MLYDSRKHSETSAEPIDASTTLHIAASEVLGHELFPIKLGRMERYMLWDDLENYPKRFRVANRFEGSIDPSKFRVAVLLAVRRHALLLAIPDHKSNPTRWVLPSVGRVDVIFGQGCFEEAPTLACNHWTKLEDYRGLRIWVSHDGHESEVVFDFHHANCDGLGGRSFVKDLLLAYNHIVATDTRRAVPSSIDWREWDRDIRWPHLDPQLLLGRDSFRPIQNSANVRSTTWIEKAVNAFHFHTLNPRQLTSQSRGMAAKDDRAPETKAASQKFCVRRHTFTALQTSNLFERCESQQVRFNDIAVALLCQVIFDWNARHRSRRQAGGRIRILIPTDLRTISDRCLPAANRLGFGFVVASGRDASNWERLLPSVAEQLGRIRGLRLAHDFLRILGMFQRLPGIHWIAHAFLRLPVPLATAVLTNLGDVTRRHRRRYENRENGPVIGALRLLQVYAIPPLRPGTALGVGMVVASGQLSVACAMDNRVFGDQDEEFFDLWIQAWQRWMDREAGRPASDPTMPVEEQA